jgi:hypothetical protein
MPAIRAIDISLTLTLLVLGVLLADDPVHAFAADHLAVLAQLLDGRPYFHGVLSFT